MWRACMELRCACRSTNISETSRFGYSISYILRLMAISSTENAQCGVLPSTTYTTGLNHVALPTRYHAHRSIFRNIFGDRVYVGFGRGSHRRLEGGGRCRQHPVCRMQRSEEHTSELQSRFDLVCRLLLEKKII